MSIRDACKLITLVSFVGAIALIAACPPTPPVVAPDATVLTFDGGSCAIDLDAGVPRPCEGMFHNGDKRPCADCGAGARSCFYARAAIWCASAPDCSDTCTKSFAKKK